MTVEKPNAKQLQSRSQAQADNHFQPTMNRWNSRSYWFSQTNEGQKRNQLHHLL